MPHLLDPRIIQDPSLRQFPPFSLVRLLGTVFAPTSGCRVCILTDFDDPAGMMKNFRFLEEPGHPVQKKAHEVMGIALPDLSELEETK